MKIRLGHVLRRPVLSPFLLLAAAACSGSGNGAAAQNPSGALGSAALLTGDPVGLDLDLPSKLTRVIPADVSGSDMTGDKAYLGRFSATDESYWLFVPVTNTGTRLQCFVQAVTFDMVNDDGTPGGTIIDDYVYGSVGRGATSVVDTNTCIAPGATGYLIDPAAVSFATLASVRAVMSSEARDYVPPPTSVIPLSYSAPERGQPYTVTIANQGPKTATVSEATVIYFDDSDIPAFSDTLWVVTHDGGVSYDLAPGATTLMTTTGSGSVGSWTGTSSKQLVMIDFSVYLSSSLSSSDLDATKAKEVLRLRAQRGQRLRESR